MKSTSIMLRNAGRGVSPERPHCDSHNCGALPRGRYGREAAFALLALLFAWAAPAFAEVTVGHEQLNPADAAWKFQTIPGPCKSDLAQGAIVTLTGNEWHAGGGGGAALVNGRLPDDPLELAEEAWLSHANTNDGAMLLDLGKVHPVAAVSTYSWHENPPDHGCRGPQVYTLLGSADGERWRKLADVDTRPNTTGHKWNGQHGVSITDTSGELGDFRYLRFALQRTRSPLQRDVGVSGTMFAEIDVHSAATLPKAGDATAGPDYSHIKEVIVVIKTHFDIGYTHRVKEIVHHYRTEMIDKAMNIMDQSKSLPPEQQFAWTGPGWVMSKVLEDWDSQTPARRQRLDDFVKAGKFRFHALPFTLESDACEPEEMARGFIFASQLCRQYGMPLPRSGKKTDVPSHGGALVTVLAHGGVQFMHIGCNWPSGCVKTPGLFWWEGPDGSRVLTFYSNTYGTCVPSWLPRWYSDQDPFIARNLAPAADWPYPIWPAIIVTPDNSGPPKADQVKALFEDAVKRLPGVKIRMGTMDDFVDAILREKPDIPVVKGEMPDTWIHGIMCDPGGIKLSREVHPQIAAAEALHTQLNLWGVAQPPVAKDIALAYEKALLYGEHTWGGAASVNQYGEAFAKLDPKKYADLEASWEDKTDYIRETARISRRITDANLQALASTVKHDGPGMVVFNPLPWTRSGTVEMNGETVFVKDVPPCGYRALPLPPASMRMAPRKTTEPATIESACFKLTLDPGRGAVTSLVDKRTGREWVEPADGRALGQYLNERFTFEQAHQYTMKYQQGRAGNWPHPGMHKPGMISEKQVPYRAASTAKGTATIEGNTATLECPADPANHLPATVLRITLPPNQPCVDLELTLKDKARDNWPEADWLCLPFKIASPQFRVHRQLGVMNPATDILPGANRDLFTVGHGLTITDADGAGIAVCPLDHPLVSLDRPGCWRASKDAADFTPQKPVVYLNLYNNQWNTNFRYWYPGTWSSRVRLWTFNASTPRDAVMATPALEARNPLLAVALAGQGDQLPSEQSGLTVSRKGAPVTAFGANPDGPGTLLRVWEMAGTAGEVAITLPAGAKFTTATPVDLRGEKASEPKPIANGKVVLNLGAYAPASFVLR